MNEHYKMLTILLSDFIQKSDAEHIRGTECDQKILSKKESSGQVFSPNYPFPYQVDLGMKVQELGVSLSLGLCVATSSTGCRTPRT